MPSTSAITTGAVLAGVASYLFYFDYQRRHSPEFRRELRQKNSKHSKQKEASIKAFQKQQRAEIEDRIDAANKIAPIPADVKEREAFFMAEIQQADQAVNSGQYIEAALSFYRALVAYPEPMSLLGMYEKSIPQKEVLELVRTMIVLRPPVEVANFIKKSLSGNLD